MEGTVADFRHGCQEGVKRGERLHTLDGGAGNDVLAGGTGNDVYFVDGNDSITENTNEGIDTFIGTITDISVTTFSNSIENLIYTGINPTTIKGNNLNNFIIGGINSLQQ